MLKEYLKENNISMYWLAKETGIPYSTINDLSNGRVDVDNCQVSMLRLAASVLHTSMDDLYQICKVDRSFFLEMYNTWVTVTVKNKTYYAEFDFEGKHECIRLCDVNDINTKMIMSLAELSVEDYLEERKLEVGYAGIHSDEKK